MENLIVWSLNINAEQLLYISSFTSAIAGAILSSIVNTLINKAKHNNED